MTDLVDDFHRSERALEKSYVWIELMVAMSNNITEKE
jgi:hypothetical protein